MPTLWRSSYYEEPSANAGPNQQVCDALTTDLAATAYTYLRHSRPERRDNDMDVCQRTRCLAGLQ